MEKVFGVEEITYGSLERAREEAGLVRPERQRPRDSQRSRVYAAEKAAFSEWAARLTLEQCEAYVAKVWARVWDADFPTSNRGSQPPTVKDGRGTRRALSYGGTIGLPRWARKEWVILHELAHELTARKFAGHGPEYVACYLQLVEIFLGFEQREKLGAEFLKRRVKTRP